MYYKNEFQSAEHLIKEIEEYKDYYSNKRIRSKLKGLSRGDRFKFCVNSKNDVLGWSRKRLQPN